MMGERKLTPRYVRALSIYGQVLQASRAGQWNCQGRICGQMPERETEGSSAGEAPVFIRLASSEGLKRELG